MPDMRKRAQRLRANATKEERHLWYDFLRSYPVQFHRQKVLGKYIVDFCAPQVRLVVELDGSQHFEEPGLTYDRERSAYLEKRGLLVLRFSNTDIMRSFDAVCREIDRVVRERMR